MEELQKMIEDNKKESKELCELVEKSKKKIKSINDFANNSISFDTKCADLNSLLIKKYNTKLRRSLPEMNTDLSAIFEGMISDMCSNASIILKKGVEIDVLADKVFKAQSNFVKDYTPLFLRINKDKVSLREFFSIKEVTPDYLKNKINESTVASLDLEILDAVEYNFYNSMLDIPQMIKYSNAIDSFITKYK